MKGHEFPLDYKIMIMFKDVFTIVEDKDKLGRTIYRLRFNNDNTMVPNGMTNQKNTIEKLGYRWIAKNPKQARDIVFEIEVLGGTNEEGS